VPKIRIDASDVDRGVRENAKRMTGLQHESFKAFRGTCRRAKNLASRYSGATDHSLAELRRMGHPYRRGGRGLHTGAFPTWHVQSGGLFMGWQYREFMAGDFMVHAELSNSATVSNWNLAQLLEHGTQRMIARPLTGSVRTWAETALREALDAAVQKVLHT